MRAGGTCVCCGQPLPIVRLGVRMSALKARLVDAIQRGAANEVMAGITKSFRAHVWQINEELEIVGSPWRIVCGRGYRQYHIERLTTTAAAETLSPPRHGGPTMRNAPPGTRRTAKTAP